MVDWKQQRQQVAKLSVERGKTVYEFLTHFIKRCIHDRVTITAGHLTYVSLLSFVPLVAVIFAVFATFPMFEDMRRTIEEALIGNLVPASGDAIREYLNKFVENASQLSAVGSIFLFVVAIMLMSVIDRALNYIWRIKKRRRFIISLAVYWMVLTLGPVLVGISIGVSSYLLSVSSVADDYISGIRTLMLTLLPFFATLVAFLLLYIMVPNKVVRARHAIWGALFSALAFELAKLGFGLYLQYFPAYEVIYGAVATIPILIVWIFLSWNIILLGAELTASVEEFLHEKAEPTPEEEQDLDTDHDREIQGPGVN
ncbi:YihY/virulence factor BrkB family protein [Aliidiomarina minuta]|uniref:UPF0761 membrane protein CWE09_12135 n=1 Tax=Aliidiomarina minuta TaxID=880057 RepID=A0A432W3G5_9GAMM|nr:virulence factor BrkB family protein [Aliidiomarina minuta]RUO23893.1 YihY/virulence factor BrkB family protein [Aliidiomarina minuta]